MNPRRRRFARARRSLRRMVEQWVQAHHDSNFTAMTRLEKLAPLEEFARALKARGVDHLPALIRRRVLRAALRVPGV